MNDTAQMLLLQKKANARIGALSFLTDSEQFICAEIEQMKKRMSSLEAWRTRGDVE